MTITLRSYQQEAIQSVYDYWGSGGGKIPFPKTTEEALDRTGELQAPQTISVKPNGKYFNITGRSFPRKEAVA